MNQDHEHSFFKFYWKFHKARYYLSLIMNLMDSEIWGYLYKISTPFFGQLSTFYVTD